MASLAKRILLQYRGLELRLPVARLLHYALLQSLLSTEASPGLFLCHP